MPTGLEGEETVGRRQRGVSRGCKSFLITFFTVNINIKSNLRSSGGSSLLKKNNDRAQSRSLKQV